MNSYESEPEAFIYFKIKLELWAIHSALSCIDSITPPPPLPNSTLSVSQTLLPGSE